MGRSDSYATEFDLEVRPVESANWYSGLGARHVPSMDTSACCHGVKICTVLHNVPSNAEILPLCVRVESSRYTVSEA